MGRWGCNFACLFKYILQKKEENKQMKYRDWPLLFDGTGCFINTLNDQLFQVPLRWVLMKANNSGMENEEFT